MSRSSFVALFAITLSASCSIDDRTLVADEANAGRSNADGTAGATPSGASGASAAPSAGAEAGGQAGDGGAAGESDGGAPTFADGCADLDHDRISDCNETLVANSNFATDVTKWLPETSASITWDALDLLGTTGSGSALVTSAGAQDANGNSQVAAAQCVPVHAGKVLGIWANARIDASAVNGAGLLGFWFFANPGCVGESPAFAVTAARSEETNRTLSLLGVQNVPDDMVSVRIRLAVEKPFRADRFSVRFDNVLVVER
jgi:hypothetical protein